MELIKRTEEEEYQLRLEAGYPTKEKEAELKEKLYRALDEILADNPKDRRFVFSDTNPQDNFLGASGGFLGGMGGYKCLALPNKVLKKDWKDKYDWYRFFKREDFDDYAFIICAELINNKDKINVSWKKDSVKKIPILYNKLEEVPCYFLFVDLPFEHEYYFSVSFLPYVFSDYCEKNLRVPKE